MNEKILLCSGCDAAYFPMLLELMHSVQRFPHSAGLQWAILDVGLRPDQTASLKAMGALVHAPDWPCNIPEGKIKGRTYYKACVCRPFLPQIFPGFDLYLWLDADTWVQTWDAIALFLEGARRGKLAVAAQVDRAYPRAVRVKWLWQWPYKLRGFYFSNACRAFGFKTAKALAPYHVLLAGIFALPADAPHWARWQELIKEALKKGKVFTAEQLTLGVLVYLEKYPVEILPAWTNWLCEFPPPWDEQRGMFVEPYLPHLPISILHVSGFDEMRKNRALATTLRTLSGEVFEGSLRSPYFDGERAVPLSDARAA